MCPWHLAEQETYCLEWRKEWVMARLGCCYNKLILLEWTSMWMNGRDRHLTWYRPFRHLKKGGKKCKFLSSGSSSFVLGAHSHSTLTTMNWVWAEHKQRRTSVRKVAAPAPGFCPLPSRGCLFGFDWQRITVITVTKHLAEVFKSLTAIRIHCLTWRGLRLLSSLTRNRLSFDIGATISGSLRLVPGTHVIQTKRLSPLTWGWRKRLAESPPFLTYPFLFLAGTSKMQTAEAQLLWYWGLWLG